MKSTSDLSTLLPTLFSGKPLGKRLRESVVWQVWDQAVGQPIASKARPVSFRGGVLTVVVTSAPWLQQLGYLKRQMMEAVNAALGEVLITDIYLKAGTLAPSSPPPPLLRHPSRRLTPEERDCIRREASAIPDEPLRAAVISSHEAWLRTTSQNTGE